MSRREKKSPFFGKEVRSPKIFFLTIIAVRSVYALIHKCVVIIWRVPESNLMFSESLVRHRKTQLTGCTC